MPLYKNGAFVEDPWRVLNEDEAVPADGAVVLGKTRYLAEREALAGRNAPLGLVLEAGDTLEGLEQDIGRFAMIALAFPKYADGRSYSKARILREEHNYRGELRATGNVLRDQVNFMHRCGFDALEVTHAGTIAALESGAIKFVKIHYQPASLEGKEAVPATPRPWLRVTTGRA